MNIIAKQLTYMHSNKEILFNNLNFTIHGGQKVGMVGDNGSGKSTLMQIIANVLTPSSGVVHTSSIPYYIPQHFGQYDDQSIAQTLKIDKKLLAFEAILKGDASQENFNTLDDDWNIEEKAFVALAEWGLEHVSLMQKMSTLSGGEKTRTFLAGLLIHSPKIILLDEPSNHLDSFSRNKLYELIEISRSTILIISHDRALLSLLSAIYELHENEMVLYGGNYEFYKEQKDQERQSLLVRLNEKEKELRLARKATQKVIERKQKHEIRGKKLNIKKGIGKMAMNIFQDKAEKSASILKDSHNTKMDSISSQLIEIRTTLRDPKFMKLDFNASKLHDGKILISSENVNFSYHSAPLWKSSLNFQIKSGDRVVIQGGNGSGKTTLLKLIIGELNPTEGVLTKSEFKYIYLDQEYSIIKNHLTVLEQISEYNTNFQEHEVKTILNRFLFSFETWYKSCEKLSGGEKMKLSIGCLMVNANTPDVFILDEPTNNIDIQNIEILTNAVKEYCGTVLVVSHDQYFIDQINIDYAQF
jgi:ATPase subunit of ABC transporter with duplicated ATPase domains